MKSIALNQNEHAWLLTIALHGVVNSGTDCSRNAALPNSRAFKTATEDLQIACSVVTKLREAAPVEDFASVSDSYETERRATLTAEPPRCVHGLSFGEPCSTCESANLD